MHLGAPHSTYGSSVFNLPPPQSNYGFGGGEGRNLFSDYLEQTNQPWMAPDVSDEALRNLMGFVPVAGTMYNWDQMAPWERGLSIGMDAIDIATLGGGKAVTAPIKAATRFATRGDPALTYLRMGEMPTSKAGRDVSNWEYPSYGSYFDETIPPQGDFIPSMNWATGKPEVGISTYQGLQFPWNVSEGANIFMRPMGSKGIFGQNRMWDAGQFSRPLFEVSGTPMKTLGSDLEALIDPASARYVKKVSPPNPPSRSGWKWGDDLNADDIKDLARVAALRGGAPNKLPQIDFRNPYPNMSRPVGPGNQIPPKPTITHPVTGKVIDLGAEFGKYGPTGRRTNPFARLDEIVEPILKAPAIHPVVPVALPGRVPMQLYDSDEDGNYISTTGDKILAQLDELGSKYISPGGFTWDQLATLVRRGEVSANQER